VSPGHESAGIADERTRLERRLSARVRKVAVLGLLLGLVAMVAGVDASAARADTAVIPAGTPDPWSDPSHQGVLERFASNVASMIAGRSVSVRCEDQAAWNALIPTDAANVAGFVTEPPHSTTTRVIRSHYVWRWKVVHGKRTRYRRKVSYTAVITHPDMFVSSATTIELSPGVCQPLQQFGEANVKPTKCQPGTAAPVPCFLGSPTSEYPGICQDAALTVCFATATDWSEDYFTAYATSAQALLTLAHESIHLQQATAGAIVPPDSLIESQAECSGMQWTARVAEQFGDSPDDAQTIAAFYWLIGYPVEASASDPYSLARPYWSADCKPGGPLDIRPAGSTVWP
jgi:hypothetical protein